VRSLAPRTLFILVDGLGLGSPDPGVNPLYSGVCPGLLGLLENHAVPLDAGMGMPGIPQSATGQTALFTGVNAAQAMGRHVEGFPGPGLRDIIRQHNIYDKLIGLGFRSTFANAYYVDDMEEVHSRRRQSVTTVAALKAFGVVRDRAEMMKGQAVYQDLTRASLRERGYEGDLITPAESAHHLLGIAAGYDFTMFEYFQTDRMGHKGTRDEVEAVLALFDQFLAEVSRFAEEEGNLLVLTSDHGNIEVSSTPLHTTNPVPLVAVGNGAERLKREAKSILDVAPLVLRLYEGAMRREHGA
jgi:2,3-bisphosphoglycerate-independent phosphoglycerate mutase